MGFRNKMLDPVKRRAKARCVRALCQDWINMHTVDQAAEKLHISRATAYRIVEELEAWEETATPQDEAREIMAQTRLKRYEHHVWRLTSGNLAQGYAQGHDGIGPELFGGTQESSQNLSVDPLCE